MILKVANNNNNKSYIYKNHILIIKLYLIIEDVYNYIILKLKNNINKRYHFIIFISNDNYTLYTCIYYKLFND